MAQYNFILPAEIEKKIKDEAIARGLSRVDIVREALKEYFERREKKRARVKGMAPLVPVVEKE
jgi:predicted transcriptional regulator